MVFIRSAFLLVAGSALFASPASAQTTINYLSGTNDSTSYSTTSPDGPLTLSVATGTATQSGALVGTGSVIKVGVGTLSLTGSNSYEGGTVLNEGTLRIGDSNALGTGLVTINGGTLGNAEGGDFGTENLFTATADFGLDVQGPGRILDFFSNVEMGTSRTVTFTGDGIACFEGGVSGHNITFLTGGEDATVTFCSDVSNTFTGTLRIGDGIHLELWKIGNDFDPPVIAISGDLLVDQGATAILITPEQFAATSNLELNGTLRGESTGTNTVQMLSGTGTVEGVNGDTLAISSGSFAGTITNAQAIIKQDVGMLTLSGSNSYTDGTSVLSGTLRIANAYALGDGNVTVMNDGVIYVDAGIALDVGATHSVTLATNGAASYQKEFADGESLANFGAIISDGSNATGAQILSGTASSGKTVSASFDLEPSAPAGNDAYRISDVFSLTGLTGETFVMQLSYTQTAFNQAMSGGLYESESELRIGWWIGGEWVVVADGVFVEGAWNGSMVLGTYGVDEVTNTVWAVTNHNSEFSVVPEPSTLVLSGMGLAGILAGRRRREELLSATNES